MLIVVFDDIVNSFVQQREYGIKDMSNGEFYDVIEVFSLLQCFIDEVISCEIGLQ